jgi:hypothetical protein
VWRREFDLEKEKGKKGGAKKEEEKEKEERSGIND